MGGFWLERGAGVLCLRGSCCGCEWWREGRWDGGGGENGRAGNALCMGRRMGAE